MRWQACFGDVHDATKGFLAVQEIVIFRLRALAAGGFVRNSEKYDWTMN